MEPDTAAVLAMTPAVPTGALLRPSHWKALAPVLVTGWGPSGDRYLRLVFADEPTDRLGDLRERSRAAFG